MSDNTPEFSVEVNGNVVTIITNKDLLLRDDQFIINSIKMAIATCELEEILNGIDEQE